MEWDWWVKGEPFQDGEEWAPWEEEEERWTGDLGQGRGMDRGQSPLPLAGLHRFPALLEALHKLPPFSRTAEERD